ncbi:MAG: hypothetical protein CMF46_01390 [Legionellales bacterium]|nr:hypothetical protein [Legionellales bacterium]|tara:strand:+ start:32 stop:646 length:615 start_codon:yes stop_codon:yes gene_type:complete
MTQTINSPQITWFRTLFNSGYYDASLLDCAHYANKQIDYLLDQHHQQSLCAIFDIDDTLLSSKPFLLMYGAEFTQVIQEDWYRKSECPAIQPIIDLYHKLQNKGIPIYLLSGRSDYLWHETRHNLEKAGVTEPKAIYLRPEAETGKVFKQRIRKDVITAKHQVLMNISDKASDLIGTDAYLNVKLPHLYHQGFNCYDALGDDSR